MKSFQIFLRFHDIKISLNYKIDYKLELLKSLRIIYRRVNAGRILIREFLTTLSTQKLEIPNLQNHVFFDATLSNMSVDKYLLFGFPEFFDKNLLKLNPNKFSIIYYSRSTNSIKSDLFDCKMLNIYYVRLSILDYLKNFKILIITKKKIKAELSKTENPFDSVFLKYTHGINLSGINYQSKIQTFFGQIKNSFIINREGIVNKNLAIYNYFSKFGNNTTISSPLRFLSDTRLSNYIPEFFLRKNNLYLPDYLIANDFFSNDSLINQIYSNNTMKIQYKQQFGNEVLKKDHSLHNRIVVKLQSPKENQEGIINDTIEAFKDTEFSIFLRNI